MNITSLKFYTINLNQRPGCFQTIHFLIFVANVLRRSRYHEDQKL